MSLKEEEEKAPALRGWPPILSQGEGAVQIRRREEMEAGSAKAKFLGMALIIRGRRGEERDGDVDEP